MINVNDTLELPDDAVELSASRSGGPGGQHVNKTSTRVTLRFDVAGSPHLGEAQRAVLRERLASRLTVEGVLVLHASEFRSQHQNREGVLARFAALLAAALRPRRPRRATAVPRSSREGRLVEKRRRAAVKAGRRRETPE
ncbi:MAG: aminoacyl-tRNA hydrolase [Acidobacteria bacterium]|nr:aminoacyl-tRNA hydrolase [Acidobacteriota bacterium]